MGNNKLVSELGSVKGSNFEVLRMDGLVYYPDFVEFVCSAYEVLPVLCTYDIIINIISCNLNMLI